MDTLRTNALARRVATAALRRVCVVGVVGVAGDSKCRLWYSAIGRRKREIEETGVQLPYILLTNKQLLSCEREPEFERQRGGLRVDWRDGRVARDERILQSTCFLDSEQNRIDMSLLIDPVVLFN